MSRRRPAALPAPYLRRILLEPDRVADWTEYPFSLSLFAARDFELPFERPITMATHSPVLMSDPGAKLLGIDGAELKPVAVRETEHFRLLKSFFEAPEAFIEEALEG